MSKDTAKVDAAVIREGWKTLVKKMGIVKATRFLVAFEHCHNHTFPFYCKSRSAKTKPSRLTTSPNSTGMGCWNIGPS